MYNTPHYRYNLIMFKVIVIGKGMFGAATARHLSQHLDNVAIIGPDEPQNPATHQDIYGAHYDEGRITYRFKGNPLWSELAHRALSSVPALQTQSGISFHTPTGYLYVRDTPMNKDDLQQHTALAERYQITYEQLNQQTLPPHFPYLHFEGTYQGLWEKAPAGLINPRRYIQAALAAAQQQGTTIIANIVTNVSQEKDSILLTTQSGHTYQTEKVVIAAGAFSNGFNLLPRPVALRLKQEFVLMAQLPTSEVTRLQGMPPIVCMADSDKLADVYILPPLPYPDGHHYLKLGANTIADNYVQTAAEICAWYREGHSDIMLADMQHLLLTIFPNLQVTEWHTQRCVITRTAHGQPYIDVITPGRIYSAIGGNGQGAKVADAIGELAAQLTLHDRWQDSLSASAFTAVYQDDTFTWQTPPLLRHQRGGAGTV